MRASRRRSPKILAAMPKGDENQQLQLHYLYALRTVTQGWTAEQKTQLAELFGPHIATGAAARSSSTSSDRCSMRCSRCSPRPAEQQILYEKAPDFSPLTPEQLAELQAKQAAVGSGRRRPAATPRTRWRRRRAGRVISRQEMLEETVFQPQQNLDREPGGRSSRRVCASCHRFGGLGTDHGVAGLNLTRPSSWLEVTRCSKRS